MSYRVSVRRGETAAQAVVWPGAEGTGTVLAAGNPDGTPCAPPSGAADVEERVRASRQAGYQEGLQAGRAESLAAAQGAARTAAEKQLRPVLETLAGTIAELASLAPRLREQAEADLVRLAVAIARRVLNRELATDPQAIEGLIQAALRKVSEREVSRVRVHPEHVAVIQAAVSRAGRENGIEVAGDPALARGAAIFESAGGDLDASAETQLREIERGLTDRFQKTR